MSASNSSESLWLSIMKNIMVKHGDKQKKRWREVSSDSAECQLCDEPGGGVVIRCSGEKCVKEFHLDCAFHQGGLSLEDDGVITFQCSTHFKPVLFCVCKEKYDDTKSMIFCDECCEWYHDACVGLNPKDASRIESYVCNTCKALLKAGKSVSKTLKEKNLAKEYQSSCHQTAIKALGLLVELAGAVCPLVDDISLTGNKCEYSIKEVREACEYLSSPPFDLSKLTPEQREDNNIVERLGVLPLIQQWRDRMLDYLKNYDKWMGEVSSLYARVLVPLAGSMDASEQKIISEVSKELQRLHDHLTKQLKSVPVDAECFFALMDCIDWMNQYLSLLHSESKSEQWFNQLSLVIRSASPKTKRLNSCSKDSFCETFLPFFVEYVKAGVRTVNEMTQWYQQACDILNGDDNLYSLETVEAFLKQGSDFPSLPYMHSEVSALLDESRGLEKAILAELGKKKAEETVLQELVTKKNELSVLLPSDGKLNLVNSKLTYLEAYQMTMASERIKQGMALSVAALGKEAAADAEPENRSTLSKELNKSINDAVKALNSLVKTAEEAKAGLDIETLSKSETSEYGPVLETLKGLKIITAEEELFEFFNSFKEFEAKAHSILNRATRLPLSEAEAPLEALDATLQNNVIDTFPVVAGLKQALRKSHSALLDISTTARKAWSIMDDYCRECEQGVQVSSEDFQAALQSARDTLLSDDVVEAAAERLQKRAAELVQECEVSLGSISDATEGSIQEAQRLMSLGLHAPLPKALMDQIRNRRDVCSTVFKCRQYVESATSASVDKETVSALRELKNTLDRLHSEMSEEVNIRLIQSVFDKFSLLHWCTEVRFMWRQQTHTSLSTAEKLLSEGESLGAAAQSTPEWSELNSEMAKSRQHSTAAEEALSKFKQVRSEINAAHGSMSALKQSMEMWTAQTTLLQTNLEMLLIEESSMKITQHEISVQLKETLDEMTLVSSAHSIISTIEEVLAVPTSEAPALQVVDFKDVTAAANKLSLLTEKDPSFKLLKDLSGKLFEFHAEAAKWNDSAAHLIPVKSTRIKNKSSTSSSSSSSEVAKSVTKQDLLNALAQPIARAIRTPMHEKVELMLFELTAFREELLNFLTSDSVLPHPSEVEAFYQDNFDTKLYGNIQQLYGLRLKSELIPVDIPEFRLLSWVIEVFEWIGAIPYPGDDLKSVNVTLSIARDKLEAARPLIVNVPTAVVDMLSELQLYDPQQQCYRPSAHVCLQQAKFLFDHLQQQVKKTEELQSQIQSTLNRKSLTEDVYQQFVNQMAQLLVQPENQVRRALEKAGQEFGEESDDSSMEMSAPASGRRQVKSSHLDDAYEFEEDNFDGVDGSDGYWEEKKKESKKRRYDGRDAAASVVGLSETRVRDKPAKKSRQVKCAGLDCPRTVMLDSTYCSDECAFNTAPELFLALLRYREILTTLSNAKRLNLKTAGSVDTFAADIAASEIKALSNAALVAEIDTAMTKKGFIARPTAGDLDTSDFSALDQMLVSLGNSQPFQTTKAGISILPPKSPTAAGEKKNSSVQALLYALPNVAPSVFFNGDTVEDTTHPTTPTGSAAAAAPKIFKTSGMSVDDEMRMKVRYSIEDFLIKSLQRLNVPGAVSLGAVFAVEFEEELCNKYAFAPAKGSTKKDFDKKEYRKHHMMLMKNLRQQHNDKLILDLVSCSNDMSFPKLLSMTAQQLADSSIQAFRQEQLTKVFDNSHRTSTEEVLEAKRREVNTGLESWREKGTVLLEAEEKAAASASSAGTPGVGAVGVDDKLSESKSSTKSTIRSLEIEQKVKAAVAASSGGGGATGSGAGAAPHTAKRPIDADAITRMTSGPAKPAKLPKLSIDDEEIVEPKAAVESPKESVTPKAKAPNMLELLKATAATSSASGSSSSGASASKPSSRKSSSSSSIVSPSKHSSSSGASSTGGKLFRLVNSEGGNNFTISRPGGLSFTCTGVVADRRAQGLIKDSFVVQGRTKLAEFEKFVKELQDTKKKLVIPFRLSEVEGGGTSNNAYKKFVDEFTRDSRAGMCNVSEGVVAYLLPPALRRSVPLLAAMKENDEAVTSNMLYCVLVSKEPGPEQYVEAEPVFVAVSKVSTVAAAAAAASVPVGSSAVPGVAPPVRPALFPGQGNAFPSMQPAATGGLNAFSTQAPAQQSVQQVPRPNLFPSAANAGATAASGGISAGGASAAAGAAAAAAPLNKQKHMEETIKKVAQFCASKGVATLQTLKDKEESKTLMPFLFEGNPGYIEFMTTLRELVMQQQMGGQQQQQQQPPIQQQGPPGAPQERVSRFGPR